MCFAFDFESPKVIYGDAMLAVRYMISVCVERNALSCVAQLFYCGKIPNWR
jgi:hypothetical protein